MYIDSSPLPLVPHVCVSFVSGNGLLPFQHQAIRPVPEPCWLNVNWTLRNKFSKIYFTLLSCLFVYHGAYNLNWIELNWNWKKMNWIGIELKDSESDLNWNWIELKNPEFNSNWNWIELKEMNWSEPWFWDWYHCPSPSHAILKKYIRWIYI